MPPATRVSLGEDLVLSTPSVQQADSVHAHSAGHPWPAGNPLSQTPRSATSTGAAKTGSLAEDGAKARFHLKTERSSEQVIDRLGDAVWTRRPSSGSAKRENSIVM